MRNDHHHDITSELARHNIVPEVSHTRGGHLRFKWKANNHNQSLVTSSTPSDHRTGKNAVARVRRLLRDAGLEKAAPVERATPMPAVASPTIEERIANIERDVLQILTMLRGMQAPKGEAKIEAAPPQQPPVKPVPKPHGRGRPPINPVFLWRVMRYDEFLGVTAIAKACNKPVSYVSNLLCKLKQRGLAQHRPGVGWRKDRKVEEMNGHAH
jgi:hypothetical protein